MIDADWAKIKNFNKEEKWGNPHKMNKNLIFLLDNWREDHGIIFNVFNGWAKTGHNKLSMHYLGDAVDGELKNTDMINSFLLANKYDNYQLKENRFTGVGCYYGMWKRNNKYINGLHLDVRTINNNKIATWGCLPEINIKNQGKRYSYMIFNIYGYKKWNNFYRFKNQVYVPLDKKFFEFVVLSETTHLLGEFKN